MHTTTPTSDTTTPGFSLTGGSSTVAPTTGSPTIVTAPTARPATDGSAWAVAGTAATTQPATDGSGQAVTGTSVTALSAIDGSGQAATATAVANRPVLDMLGQAATAIAARPVMDRLGQAVAMIVAGLDRTPTVDGELSELTLTLRAADRLMARAVMLAREVDGHRAAVEEGMHVDLALQLHTDTTRSDIAMVLTAAEILATMPATALLFNRGVFSWGHIRILVTGVRRLDATTRAELDRELDVQADRLAAMEPEARVWALDEAIERRLSERHLEQRETRTVEQEFLALQARFDGSGTAYGEFGPVSFAALTAGLDAEADTPQAAPCPGDQDGPDQTVPTRGQQYAAALLRLCTRTATSDSGSTDADSRGDSTGARTGGSGAGGGVGARISVIVDLDRLTNRTAGEITNAINKRPARITRRALEQLSCDAALDLVIQRGTNLLAAQRYAPDITAPVRRAVQVRDGGCRFPGCTAPVAWCDVHHVHERARGGDHRPDNLVLLCRRHHTSVHQRGWHQTLLTDGTYTIRRRGRTWTTLPRRDQRWEPPDPTPDGEPPSQQARPGDATPPHGAALPPSATDPPSSDRDPSRLSTGSGPPPLDVTDPLPF